MSRGLSGKIKLNTFEELLGGSGDGAIEVPLTELHEFLGHPFRVLDDEKMEETVQSIREHGVLIPGIVRKREGGGYEIIAGHRRKRACEIAGLSTMPVIVRDYSDDEAICAMVDSNIQREDVLPSEKAKAYQMKYEAMKHQGVKENGRTLEELGRSGGESWKTVQRFVWLARLNDDLLTLVDNKKIPMSAGVELSYLNEGEQKTLYKALQENDLMISIAQASEMKKLSQSGELSKAVIRLILEHTVEKPRKFVLKGEKIAEFFPEGTTDEEIEEKILELLKKWRNEQK